jgi:hypothetical protein
MIFFAVLFILLQIIVLLIYILFINFLVNIIRREMNLIFHFVLQMVMSGKQLGVSGMMEGLLELL